MKPEQTVVDYLVKLIEHGTIPWKCPTLFPRNAESGLRYSGISALLLSSYAINNKGYNEYWRMTDQGVTNNKHHIICYQERKPTLQVVCNEGSKKQSDPNYLLADRLVDTIGKYVKIDFVEEPRSFYYYPPVNRIEVPSRIFWLLNQGNLSGYYNCLFHEFMHYDELFAGIAQKEDCPTKELRAEMGAAFLMSEMGIPQLGYRVDHFGGGNTLKWRTHWLSAMKADCRYIFRVAESVTLAVDSLLGKLNVIESRLDENTYYN